MIHSLSWQLWQPPGEVLGGGPQGGEGKNRKRLSPHWPSRTPHQRLIGAPLRKEPMNHRTWPLVLCSNEHRVAVDYTPQMGLVLLPRGPTSGAEAPSINGLEQSWLHIGTIWQAFKNNRHWGTTPREPGVNGQGAALGIRIVKAAKWVCCVAPAENQWSRASGPQQS